MGDGHWHTIARTWHHVGPPLRPTPADLALVDAAARRSGEDALSVLILGVTPELAVHRWPAGSRVWAIDHTPAMIAGLWPGAPGTALLGGWTALPLATDAIDLVVCDGGLHLLSHPRQQRALVEELERVLRPGGRAVFRLFLPPLAQATVDEVLTDHDHGLIPDVNHLKYRLWMALRDPGDPSVALGEVWSALAARHPDLDALAKAHGWSPDSVATLAGYRDAPDRYDLVERSTVEHLFTGDGAFAVESDDVPSDAHALSAACPTLVFRRAS